MEVKIAGYLIEKKLGSGSYGTVYLAQSEKYGLPFAIKVIPIRDGETAEMHEKKYREALTLQQVVHPNVLRIYDFFEDDGNFIIIFEYCGGGTLLNLIREAGKLDKASIQYYFIQIFSAIKTAHELDVTHRDLKPENIFLDSYGRPKIGDWGQSRLIGPDPLLKSACGTRAYAPPEIWDKKAYYGKASDMWSIGVVLYCCTFGCLPWRANTEMEMYEKIRNMIYVFPYNCDREIKEVIQGLLQRDPKARLTAAEVLSMPLFAKGVPLRPNIMPTEISTPTMRIGQQKCLHAQTLPISVAIRTFKQTRKITKGVTTKSTGLALVMQPKVGNKLFL